MKHWLGTVALLVIGGGGVCRAPAQTADEFVAQGRDIPQERNPSMALAYFDSALSLDRENYEANWRAAQAMVDIGKQWPDDQKNPRRDSLYAFAESLAKKAVQVNPDGADGHYALALSLGRTSLTKSNKERVKYAKEIRAEVLRALELNPQHDRAEHILGRWHAEIRRLSGFTRFFAKTFLGAGIFNEASWQQAIEHLNRAVELSPQTIYHHLDLAEIYIDVGQYSNAREHLDEVGRLPDFDYMDPRYKDRALELLKKIEGKKDKGSDESPGPE